MDEKIAARKWYLHSKAASLGNLRWMSGLLPRVTDESWVADHLSVLHARTMLISIKIERSLVIADALGMPARAYQGAYQGRTGSLVLPLPERTGTGRRRISLW
jgi:hypothetical protein